MVRSSKLEFPNSAGNGKLAARFDEPAGEIRAYALFAHCFTCSKDSLAATRIAGALAARGIAVLRFDFTGLGASDGEFANTNFSSNVADLIAAADHLRQTRRAPDILIGHSLGGAAVLAAAGAIPEAKAVATIGAPSDPAHVTNLFKAQTAEIEQKGEALVQLAGRSFTIQRQFLEDVAQHSLHDRIAALHRPLLICHAPRDQIVGIENASWIFEAARHPKSFLSLDNADHLLTKREDAVYVAEVVAAWAGRYLAAPQEDAAAQAAAEQFPHGVVVHELGIGNYTQRIAARSHSLLADEPEARGGKNRGMAPHELVLAGLGACTSMTLRMYADRKKWALGRVTVALDYKRVPADERGNTARIDRIERIIHVADDLTEEQRAKLVEIADKCPMHRLLMATDKVIATRVG